VLDSIGGFDLPPEKGDEDEQVPKMVRYIEKIHVGYADRKYMYWDVVIARDFTHMLIQITQQNTTSTWRESWTDFYSNDNPDIQPGYCCTVPSK
jgi:hypothetical protein